MSGADVPFAFVEADPCRAPLDRADHLRDDADALGRLWSTARVLLLDERGRALSDADGAPFLPTGAALSAGPGGPGAATFLGLDGDGQAWFALEAALVAADAPGALDLRSAAAQWSAFHAGVFAQAQAMHGWRGRHRFCGSCGGPLAIARAGWTARCGGCGAEHYPRTDPAVIAAVTDGHRLLLGRQSVWPARRWSVLAGFVEPGESFEQTVAREVREESGVRVRRCRYLASQPWPFPGALMVGFLAEAEPDAPRAGDELEAVGWFTPEEVRAAWRRDAPGGEDDGGMLLSHRISIARWLIGRWLADVEGSTRATG
ncbi:MAG TPA: NAD(+) diphosphatase [Lysobacter sp.]|nr:NAD(+) diphosphatase [Lysobacter sp.]